MAPTGSGPRLKKHRATDHRPATSALSSRSASTSRPTEKRQLVWPLVKPERLLVLAVRYGIKPAGIPALGNVDGGLQDIGDVVPEDEEEEMKGSEGGESLTQ